MADSKLAALTEFAGTLAPDDWLYMVDKSDTTDDPTGSSFKVQVKNLLGRVLIQSITNTTAGEFDFDSIPSGYKRLVIEGYLRSDISASNSTSSTIYFNSDTTDTNYHRQRSAVSNGVAQVGEANSTEFAAINGSTSTTDAYSYVRAVIEDYAGSKLKAVYSSYGTLNTTGSIFTGSTYTINTVITAAITRVRIRATGYSTNNLFGVLTLYGEN